MESALNTSIFGMLVARRLSPKRYANFAKSVVDHLEHLAQYHLMWNPKNIKMDQTFFQRERNKTYSFNPFDIFDNSSGQTQKRQCVDKAKLLIENIKHTPKRFQRITLLGFTSSQRSFMYRLQFQEVSGHNFNVLASKKLWSSLFV